MLRYKDGFSIMTVMIGSVVVAALAVVYMQKARNKAQIAAVTDIIAYRDYVFRYYSEVAANRMAWPCTLKANPDLHNYVKGAGSPGGPHNLWLHDVSGTGCVLDGTGKEIIPGSGAGTAQGLGLKLYTNLPATVETYDPDNTNHHIRVYATWEGLGRNAVRIRLAAAYNHKHDDALTSFKMEEKETYLYMNRTPARNCSDALATGFGFYGDHGTGASAPERYFGDTAVTSVNARTRLVTCWQEGPLVIPPCYDLLEGSSFPGCPSINASDPYAGMCPTGPGFSLPVPAAAGFEGNTGRTICERNYGLILGDRRTHGTAYCANDEIAFVGLNTSHEASCKDRGVIGRRCSDGYRGWDSSGNADCFNTTKIGKPGLPGQPGIPNVLKASKGPPGIDRTCPTVTTTSYPAAVTVTVTVRQSSPHSFIPCP